MKPSIEKRLLHYARSNLKVIGFALVCLLIAVGLDLAGPFIAKSVIDNHIVGVQAEWAQVADNEDGTVIFQKKHYKRLDRIDSDDQIASYHTLVQSNRKYYDDYILHDLSFNVEPGKTAAFVGHTGSGKSSIMNLLLRFYDQQKGNIFIDQYNSKELSRQQVRQHINIVLQDPFIFTGTVLSNITLNDPKITREKAIEALKTVGADQFIEKLPLKYDQPVGENGADFSTGKRQLLSFTRALAFDPAILILDEATASIDTETEGLIQKAISILAEGRTMLIIAHRLSTIQHADQIIVMNKGKMIEKGTHDELLAQNGNYFQMFKLQQAGLAEQIG